MHYCKQGSYRNIGREWEGVTCPNSSTFSYSQLVSSQETLSARAKKAISRHKTLQKRKILNLKKILNFWKQRTLLKNVPLSHPGEFLDNEEEERESHAKKSATISLTVHTVSAPADMAKSTLGQW